MSSWFRNKYPHIALGALASSAVVDAVYDFYEFDEQVYNSLMKSGNECVEKLLKLIDYIDKNFDKGNNTLIKNLFEYEGMINMPDFDFHFFIADVIVETVQYGDRTEFCKKLKTEIGSTNDEILKWFSDWAPAH